MATTFSDKIQDVLIEIARNNCGERVTPRGSTTEMWRAVFPLTEFTHGIVVDQLQDGVVCTFISQVVGGATWPHCTHMEVLVHDTVIDDLREELDRQDAERKRVRPPSCDMCLLVEPLQMVAGHRVCKVCAKSMKAAGRGAN